MRGDSTYLTLDELAQRCSDANAEAQRLHDAWMAAEFAYNAGLERQRNCGYDLKRAVDRLVLSKADSGSAP